MDFTPLRFQSIFGGTSPSLYETLGIRPRSRFDQFISYTDPFLRKRLEREDLENQARQLELAQASDLFERQRMADRLKLMKPMDVVYQPPPSERPDVQLRKQELELMERQMKGGEAIERSKLGLEARKQALAEWKAANPEGKLVVAEDGTVNLVNPMTGEITPTGLKSNQLSEREKIALEIQGKKEITQMETERAKMIQELRNMGANQVEIQKYLNSLGLEEARQKGREIIEKMKLEQGSELETSRRVNNRALQAAAEHPEWSKYIKIDPVTGNFLGIAPPGRWSGPSQEIYNSIYSYIYGTVPSTSSAQPASEDRVEVIAPNGQRGTIPRSQLKEAVKQGYKPVGGR